MRSKLNLQADGTFHISAVTDLSHTYFPLCNTKAMKSAISPTLGGDATADQNSFLLLPTTVADLSHSLLKRNVYFRINDTFTWSITGLTAVQTLTPDTIDLYGDFLVHRLERKHPLFTCTIESFVPRNDTYQELHKITIKNTTDKPLKLKSVIGIPIYGRSADNIRDHRHVTSLLNRVKIVENGIINHPSFSFDERGHVINRRHYGVFAHSSHHKTVEHYYPTVDMFMGEGRTMLDPIVVKENIPSPYRCGDVVAGHEAMAGMAYAPVTLKQDEDLSLVLSLGIADAEKALSDPASTLDAHTFDALKAKTRNIWKEELSTLRFGFADKTLNGWLKWVTLQPILRRIYGNSFLPYHDYGRGGKGWRDLWQDLLALILMDPANVRDMLLNNFKGIRIDGSNATIIGDAPGVFIADRNNIARIWMDHGSWPLLTTKLYLDQSGDLDLLLERVSYFQDQFTHYTKQVDETYKPGANILKTKDNKPYHGTVFEHLLIQNLVPYYNVGAHNNIRLEDADWNDGLDMATDKGESVAFTAFYGQNLITLAQLLKRLHASGVLSLALFEEIAPLLRDVSQDDIPGKKTLLETFFQGVAANVSGKQIHYDTLDLSGILAQKGSALLEHVRTSEWLEENEDGWFNGYYDNDAKPLDDVKKKDMTLSGQVFAIMGGAATDTQIAAIIKSADRYLYKAAVGGYRLNTDFKEVKTNMGRLFGFAYGHKENGAMFSHMALMYANALYKRGFVEAGYKVIASIYAQCMNLETSKMYPGIPEYFDPEGRGMYPYLTGSASWMILTMVTEVFGIKGDLGLPVFEPKLILKQFGAETELSIDTMIADRQVRVTYKNPSRLTYGEYEIKAVCIDGDPVSFSKTDYGVKLHKKITGTAVDIVLDRKNRTP